MSDSDLPAAKKTRSALNVTKLLNKLRMEKGLPKVSTREKDSAPKLTPEVKEKLAEKVFQELFPQSLSEHKFILTTAMRENLDKEIKKKFEAFKAGKAKL